MSAVRPTAVSALRSGPGSRRACWTSVPPEPEQAERDERRHEVAVDEDPVRARGGRQRVQRNPDTQPDRHEPAVDPPTRLGEHPRAHQARPDQEQHDRRRDDQHDLGAEQRGVLDAQQNLVRPARREARIGR
ncbi:hypothetical protein GCM10009559_31580 [Pseudonocardia zijingensis]|uniref:Uncharacterized protein n=1 Tax=Pseudonocardia zijingensis TaxID=153376 RepID=A0ABP4APV7_9PSEU